jgi:hypothetical protein
MPGIPGEPAKWQQAGLLRGAYPQRRDANPTTFSLLRTVLMHRNAVRHGFSGHPRRFFQVVDFKRLNFFDFQLLGSSIVQAQSFWPHTNSLSTKLSTS